MYSQYNKDKTCLSSKTPTCLIFKTLTFILYNLMNHPNIMGARCSCGKLLVTTVSVSLSLPSSARIWEGLLCRVRRWCMMGNCRMVFGAVMVLEVMATLGVAAIATLEGVAGTTLRDVGLGDGAMGWPAMMVMSCQMVLRCFSLAVVVVGIAHLSCCNRLAAASKAMSSSDVGGTWQWLGYKCHLSEKGKRWVAGM
jgi:hypothetical protein